MPRLQCQLFSFRCFDDAAFYLMCLFVSEDAEYANVAFIEFQCYWI